jgi:hypothetical protein
LCWYRLTKVTKPRDHPLSTAGQQAAQREASRLF